MKQPPRLPRGKKCASKIRHPSREKAQQHRARLIAAGSFAPLISVYLCPRSPRGDPHWPDSPTRLKEASPINSWNHAQSAARKWGGDPSMYIQIEEFLDSSKEIFGDVRHRSMYHHTAGVWLCQRIFGRVIEVPRANGHGTVQVPVRLIAERHVIEDLGWLPSPADYIAGMPIKPWMSGAQRKELPLSHLLQGEPAA